MKEFKPWPNDMNVHAGLSEIFGQLTSITNSLEDLQVNSRYSLLTKKEQKQLGKLWDQAFELQQHIAVRRDNVGWDTEQGIHQKE